MKHVFFKGGCMNFWRIGGVGEGGVAAPSTCVYMASILCEFAHVSGNFQIGLSPFYTACMYTALPLCVSSFMSLTIWRAAKRLFTVQHKYGLTSARVCSRTPQVDQCLHELVEQLKPVFHQRRTRVSTNSSTKTSNRDDHTQAHWAKSSEPSQLFWREVIWIQFFISQS